MKWRQIVARLIAFAATAGLLSFLRFYLGSWPDVALFAVLIAMLLGLVRLLIWAQENWNRE